MSASTSALTEGWLLDLWAVFPPRKAFLKLSFPRFSHLKTLVESWENAGFIFRCPNRSDSRKMPKLI